MRKYSQKLIKPDANTTIWGPLFGSKCTPFAANMKSLCDLAPRTCPWVAQSFIFIICWLSSGAILATFGTYANQFVTKCQSIQDRTHPVKKKTFHCHTSTRIHKLGRREREALWITAPFSATGGRPWPHVAPHDLSWFCGVRQVVKRKFIPCT